MVDPERTAASCLQGVPESLEGVPHGEFAPDTAARVVEFLLACLRQATPAQRTALAELLLVPPPFVVMPPWPTPADEEAEFVRSLIAKRRAGPATILPSIPVEYRPLGCAARDAVDRIAPAFARAAAGPPLADSERHIAASIASEAAMYGHHGRRVRFLADAYAGASAEGGGGARAVALAIAALKEMGVRVCDCDQSRGEGCSDCPPSPAGDAASVRPGAFVRVAAALLPPLAAGWQVGDTTGLVLDGAPAGHARVYLRTMEIPAGPQSSYKTAGIVVLVPCSALVPVPPPSSAQFLRDCAAAHNAPDYTGDDAAGSAIPGGCQPGNRMPGPVPGADRPRGSQGPHCDALLPPAFEHRIPSLESLGFAVGSPAPPGSFPVGGRPLGAPAGWSRREHARGASFFDPAGRERVLVRCGIEGLDDVVTIYNDDGRLL